MSEPTLEELDNYETASKYSVTYALGHGEPLLLRALKTILDGAHNLHLDLETAQKKVESARWAMNNARLNLMAFSGNGTPVVITAALFNINGWLSSNPSPAGKDAEATK
jgi:hypothetical protein